MGLLCHRGSTEEGSATAPEQVADRIAPAIPGGRGDRAGKVQPRRVEVMRGWSPDDNSLISLLEKL